jgi:GTP-binding protein Era
VRVRHCMLTSACAPAPHALGRPRWLRGDHLYAKHDAHFAQLDSAFLSRDNSGMSEWDVPPDHRSGFVAVVGRPNVGKSTLVNAFLGQAVAAVSPRPQTTHRRQMGILTLPSAQAVFVDTPGIHQPIHKLGDHMNRSALEVMRDCDVVLMVFDLGGPPTPDDERVASSVGGLDKRVPIVTALNKVDLIPPDVFRERFAAFETLVGGDALPVSATRGDNREVLLDRVLSLLPLGPRYFPEEEVTDTYEREIAADLIRAAAMQLLRNEVPYSIAVRIDDYKERDDRGAYISATLFVERETQKGIVIGKGGSMLRQIGSLARREIEAMSGRHVYLQTRVKTLAGWRDDPKLLKRLGYSVSAQPAKDRGS